MNFLQFIFGKKSHIKFVEDYDFSEYLRRIGVFDEVISGNKFCVSCGTQITLDNLQAVIPSDNDKVSFICDKAACLKQNHD